MNKRIVIVGFMGCGKTTVGEALARRLGREMIDLDSFIAKREGRSPAEIIEQDGESAFREIETRTLRHALENCDARVIALGGGAWTIETNRVLVAEHDCLSVWLDAPFELCWERINSVTNNVRPLAPDRAAAKKLFDNRRLCYEMSGFRVNVSRDRVPGLLTDEILRRAV